MKKIFVMLCMLTCVFGLTACSDYEPSQLETSRAEAAEVMASDFVVPYMMQFVDDEVAKFYQESFDVHELEQIAEEDLYNYISTMVAYTGNNYGFNFVDVEGLAILNGIASFNTTYKSLGEVDLNVRPETSHKVSKDQISVIVYLTGTEKDADGNLRKAQVEVIFSNDIFLVVEGVALNLEQSMNELMMKAAYDTVMGMAVVFSVLILICFIIYALGYIPKLFADNKEKDERKTIKTEAVDNTIAQIIEKEESQNLAGDCELVAVIAAAIAAYEGSTSTDGFVVRSIRKRR